MSERLDSQGTAVGPRPDRTQTVMTLAIIQARMTSGRLPGKVLMDLNARPVLDWVVCAARAIPGVDKVVVATSADGSDDPVVAWCRAADVPFHRGPLDDVLERFVIAAESEDADVAVRITADCPLLDPQVAGQVVALRRLTGADYATNANPRTWPDGLDCEAFTVAALKDAAREARHPHEREHVTPFMINNNDRYRAAYLPCPIPGLGTERWTLDTQDDLEFLTALASRLKTRRPPSFLEVLSVLEAEPNLRNINTARLA